MVRSLFLALPLLAAACGSTPEQAPPAPEAAAPEVAAAPAAAAPAAPAEAVAAATNADAWIQYGEPFTLGASVPASAVLSDPASHVGKVRMTGELTEVCQKMGCWAVVRDDAGHAVRITMKDHAFGIDKGGAGRRVDLEGELVKKAVDPEQVAHYKSEGSAHPPEEGKTETYEVVASTVWLARS